MTEPPGPEARIARLERQLDRERSARRQAETISERVTRDLYDKQQGLLLVEAVTKAANEAIGLEAAMAVGLEEVRRHRGWRLGHLWLLDDAGGMVSTDVWSGDIELAAEFHAASTGLRFEPGQGLPGRVHAEHTAVWISDPEELARLPRGQAMAASRLRTVLAFPLFTSTEVVGVLEFFADTVHEPDEQILALMLQVGTQLGRVVERQRAADTLLHQATHDALTGLPNRVLILDQLGRSLARQSRRQGEQTAVFFIDLDGFKAVNDAMGHAAGDRVLREVARRLSTVIRPQDTLGRLGGDEFVIVCEALTEDLSVVTIAERLRAVLLDPVVLKGEQFQVTASVGIALAEGNERPSSLIEQADAAMYRSKELGKARYEIFSEALRRRIARQLDVERSLRHAADRDELRLHYQPEVDLRTGAVIGVEALLRWQRPEGLVMPRDFIGLAEDTGLIVPIGTWVLNEALRQSDLWEADDAVADNPWMSVNLSVRQLSDPMLVRSISGALENSGREASRLFLEVTESVILDNVEADLTVLTNLRSLGTEIAIDDFGTGYASLSYLRRFPASVVKVDGSFIAEIDRDDRSRSIVEAILAMSRSLGLTVVAEGIETAAQLQAVCEVGFDIGQGFYFARPVPAAEIAPLLGTRRPFAGLLPGSS